MYKWRYDNMVQSLTSFQNYYGKKLAADEEWSKLSTEDREHPSHKCKRESAENLGYLYAHCLFNAIPGILMNLETMYHEVAKNPIIGINTNLDSVDLIRLVEIGPPGGAPGKEIARVENYAALEVTLEGQADMDNPRRFIAVASKKGFFTGRAEIAATHSYNRVTLQLVPHDKVYT